MYSPQTSENVQKRPKRSENVVAALRSKNARRGSSGGRCGANFEGGARRRRAAAAAAVAAAAAAAAEQKTNVFSFFIFGRYTCVGILSARSEEEDPTKFYQDF